MAITLLGVDAESGHGHWHGDVYHEHAHGEPVERKEHHAHGGHGHWHGDPNDPDAVYHEHAHGDSGHQDMFDSSKIDPDFELTNEAFLEMDAQEFWNEALPKLDPSKLEGLIESLDKDHLQKMLMEMQMPGGEHPEPDSDYEAEAHEEEL